MYFVRHGNMDHMVVILVILVQNVFQASPNPVSGESGAPCKALWAPQDHSVGVRGAPLKNLEEYPKIRTLFHRNISPSLLGFLF